ncbi:MAG: DUF4249 domain-containing protein [Bacteroidetes bacterium]|nr:DUF4249 domain-containing protein [Bacteroidota bacterium]
MHVLARHILPILFCALVLVSCEKSIDWELEGSLAPQLVVEGILTNENIRQEIRLTQTFTDLNGSAPVVDDAVVRVETNGVTYTFDAVPDNPGLYRSAFPFAVVGNLLYRLEIVWQGETYSAVSVLSAVGPIPSVAFIPIANTKQMRLSNFTSTFNPGENAMYQVDIEWPANTTDSITDARLYFYTFNSLHLSQLIPPPKEPVYFPMGSKVIVKKFGLNPAFAEFLRAKNIETDWSGSYFFANPENLPTNISNDGLGFFSTCAVLTDTLIAK